MSDLKRVLLAVDSPHDVELALATFVEHKLVNEVPVVNNGNEALDDLHRRGRFNSRAAGDPIAILLDSKMPKIDRVEALRTLKADPLRRRTPGAMLTSRREEQRGSRGYEPGFNATIVKPVGFPVFVEVVKQLGEFWTVHHEPKPRMAAVQ